MTGKNKYIERLMEKNNFRTISTRFNFDYKVFCFILTLRGFRKKKKRLIHFFIVFSVLLTFLYTSGHFRRRLGV